VSDLAQLLRIGARLVILISVLLPSLPAWSLEADIYVSTTGKDLWSGRLPEPAADGTDGPLATVEQARLKVAALRLQQPERDFPVFVSVRGGVYYLDQPLTFGPQDSGTERSPTIYTAFEGERPVLSGGVRIGDWKVTAEGNWSTTLNDVQKGKWSFAQLFVNDQRRYRARLPKQGYYYIAQQLGQAQFRFSGEDIRADWTNLNDVEVLTFHDWAASRMRIASVQPAHHQVTFAGTSWKVLAKEHRYRVENVREALREPGEWYLDHRIGQLTYIPKPGEQPGRVEVIAPRLQRLLVLQGDLATKRWTQHLHFKGLTFAHTNWTLPAVGQVFPQAEIGLDATIVAVGARQIVFERCAVRHVGGYAIAFGSGSRHNRVESCELVDLGGGGVKIGHAGPGTWDQIAAVSDDPDMRVSHHVIRNCIIAHGGRLHPGAVGIWIGHSPHNTIEHNDVFDFYQTGISVGWTWGYGPSGAHDNDIGFNHVHTIGQFVTSDMGGIYTLGVQPGTIVHDNHVHDVQSFDYGGWGIYADEGSSGIVIERNLVHHTKTGGFFQHFGKENLIKNNIFALSTRFQLEGTKPEAHISFYFQRNIVFWNNDSPLIGGCHSAEIPCKINFLMDHNVYWNGTKRPAVFPGGRSFEQWREMNQDRHSLVVDPLFVDPNNGNFQLKPGSPVVAVGFTPFDPMLAGKQGPTMLTMDVPTVPPAFP
jgi:hypothetical protein